MEINGYKFIELDGDEIFVTKSKEDVLKFYHETYGTPKEMIDLTDEEFLEHLIELDLNGDVVQKKRDNLGWCYYDEYKKQALKDEGCKPVIYHYL